MNTSQMNPEGGLAARIREARRGAGLNQRELAARVGVSRQTVWSWEAGRTRPTRRHRRGLALHCKAPALAPAERVSPRRGRRSPAGVVVPREERMRAVLGVIARYAAREGYPPSMQEIMDETGFSSKSVVTYSLDWCEEAGLIVRARRLARAVRLTEAGRAFAEAHSETGSLPVRREEIAPGAPRAATALAAPTDAPPPTVLQLREGRSRSVERAR
jgi:DNA-binding XRE family transcriptional regulator/DNA-binding MarR family transcriptional regulator